MKKVRFETWYWGNYCIAPNNMELPKGFELYNEKEHGWENSEEFKLHGKSQMIYDDYKPDHIKVFIESSYYKSWVKKNSRRYTFLKTT